MTDFSDMGSHQITMMCWSVRCFTAERRFRVASCPILSVKAVYPQLVMSDASEQAELWATEAAAERFNQCYEQAAEAFVTCGVERLGPKVAEEYATQPDARYTFARRELVCTMTVEIVNETETKQLRQKKAEAKEEPDLSVVPCLLSVKIEKSYGMRRKNERETTLVGHHVWRFPKGILWPSHRGEKTKEYHKKIRKNY